MICKRCHKIMYPNARGKNGKGAFGNHKRGVCCDGFPQILKLGAADGTVNEVLWPQPAGVFVEGSKFDVDTFLHTVAQMWDDAVVATDPRHVTLEYHCFAEMLKQRLVRDGDRVLFRTFSNLSVIKAPSTARLVVEHAGSVCVRLECLEAASGGAS